MDENDNWSIAWQNKDIVSKLLAEEFRGKTFAVYGIDVPKIAEAKPTNLPAVEANELRLDNLFYLTDGSVAFVDYESYYSEENKVKYLGYLARIVKRLYNELKRIPLIRIIIIYTADVERGSTKPNLFAGSFSMELTEAFLIEQDSAAIWMSLKEKIESKVRVSDEDLMRMVIYPLTFKGNNLKRQAVTDIITLAKGMKDKQRMAFALKLIYVFSDKFITDEDADRIKEVLTMTKVDRLYYEERRKAIEENTKKVTEDVTERVTEQVTQQVTGEVTLRIAKKSLLNGRTVEEVAADTDLPLEEVQKLAVEIS